MTAERWTRIEDLYHSARRLPPQERGPFVAQACGGDDELRREVEALLAEPVSNEGFLDRPAVVRAAELETAAGVTVDPGRSIGGYRLRSLLGAGGMGEVYRAHDGKLGRDVAIKILPPAFTSDPNRLTRFQREARMLAALNHPNICAIYGLEEADGVTFLVLELVEGDTLAEILAAASHKGQHGLSTARALANARQIAEALEAAHRKGIVHRDLKPANIKLTPAGVLKVLDFGLAKTALDEDLRVDQAQSPTMTGLATLEGLVVGTPAYMSPEQARGRPVDARTDIWALGCVLLEMLTGRLAFAGSSAMDTIAKILEREPDWSALPAAVPASVERLLRACLAKDPEQRLRDIAEVRKAIDEALTSSSARPLTPGRWFGGLRWPAAAALILGLAGMAAWSLSPRPLPSAPVARFPLSLPAGQVLDQSGGAHMLALSPDGSRLAYVATPRRLYLRLMSDVEMTPIPGTETYIGVREPVFSPDGSSIAFYAFADATLKTMPVTGGPAITICKMDTPSGMNWGPDGIVFGQGGKGIWRVGPVADSSPELLASVGAGESAHGPQILPDGQHLLFTLAAGVRRSRWDKAQVVVQSLSTRNRKALFVGGDARYISTGHLIYAISGRLYAVPFDAQRLEPSGGPVEIVSGVNRASGAVTGTADYSVSTAGTGSLVYVPGPVEAPASAPLDLAVLDRGSGKEAQALGLPPGSYALPRVSPDGTRVAFTDEEAADVIWIRDLRSASEPRRLTAGAINRFPIWTGDSKRVVFQSNRDADPGIFSQAADGTDGARRLTTAVRGEVHVPESWAPKEDVMLFSVAKGADYSLWLYSGRDGATAPWGDVHSSTPTGATFSPDGKWVAYTSTQKGKTTIYVQPFPARGAVYRLPARGSDSPKHVRWSPDGKKLFYDPRPGGFESVDVTTQPAFAFEATKPLAPVIAMSPPGGRTPYDVLPDGRQVGLVTWGQKEYLRNPLDQIQVVLNWFDWIKQRVPKR